MKLSLEIHGYALELEMDSERNLLKFLAGTVAVLKNNGLKEGFDYLRKLSLTANVSTFEVRMPLTEEPDDRLQQRWALRRSPMKLTLLIPGYACEVKVESERDSLQLLGGVVDVLRGSGVEEGFDILLKLALNATISKFDVETPVALEPDDRRGRPMTWFGIESFGPFCSDEGNQVDVPVDELCLHCQEVIGPQDVGVFMPIGGQEGNTLALPIHRECLLRMVVGSVGHQLKLCPCWGGMMEDPPEASRRQAAMAAAALFEDSTRAQP